MHSDDWFDYTIHSFYIHAHPHPYSWLSTRTSNSVQFAVGDLHLDPIGYLHVPRLCDDNLAIYVDPVCDDLVI